MLDTIKLTIPSKMCSFLDKTKFLPENTNALRGYKTFVQNPTKSELLRGIYKPRLTITNRFNTYGRSEWTLSIELSLPKLLYGNNFDELSDSDFPKVIELLQSKLKDMGVSIFTALLEKAPVSSIHYSKNIPLTDGSTPYMLISKIKQANIPQYLDTNQTDYQNDGLSYKWHSNSYEVTFYDKIHDLGKSKISEKRSIEKDNLLQLDLFEEFRNRNKFEVIRMEVRLNNRQKTKKLCKILGIQTNLTFDELFNSSISQKILKYYISELKSQRLPLLDSQLDKKDLLVSIIIGNPNLSISKTLQMFGLKQVLDIVSIRELKIMFSKTNQRIVYRLIDEAEKIKLTGLQNPFKIVDEQLNNFIPLRLVDYQDNMINNDKYNQYD